MVGDQTKLGKSLDALWKLFGLGELLVLGFLAWGGGWALLEGEWAGLIAFGMAAMFGYLAWQTFYGQQSRVLRLLWICVAGMVGAAVVTAVLVSEIGKFGSAFLWPVLALIELAGAMGCFAMGLLMRFVLLGRRGRRGKGFEVVKAEAEMKSGS